MEHLKALRERRGLYQKDVAAALKIDRTTYVKYETGVSEPGYEILKRIARFYEVSIDYLLDFDIKSQKTEKEPISSLTGEELKILTEYRSLNMEGREYIKNTLFMASQIYKNESAKTSDMEKLG